MSSAPPFGFFSKRAHRFQPLVDLRREAAPDQRGRLAPICAQVANRSNHLPRNRPRAVGKAGRNVYRPIPVRVSCRRADAPLLRRGTPVPQASQDRSILAPSEEPDQADCTIPLWTRNQKGGATCEPLTNTSDKIRPDAAASVQPLRDPSGAEQNRPNPRV